MKPGIQTTEFWTTIATTGVNIAVALNFVNSESANDLVAAIVAVAASVAAVVTPVTYIVSRTWLKAKAS